MWALALAGSCTSPQAACLRAAATIRCRQSAWRQFEAAGPAALERALGGDVVDGDAPGAQQHGGQARDEAVQQRQQQSARARPRHLRRRAHRCRRAALEAALQAQRQQHVRHALMPHCTRPHPPQSQRRSIPRARRPQCKALRARHACSPDSSRWHGALCCARRTGKRPEERGWGRW